MYLKSLSLKGFKSFADKTLMSFDPGLNVVVGPNGSGKSNISDAVLWVLGEQSAKTLRGSAMEDVIFSGSSARQPVGVAEVTLVLDNLDHTLPIEFAEVAITRRMYRSGESEYLINGAPSRLRDVRDILHDTGLGRDTHSIISQGKLDTILAGKPEERRELIEEAAGISKHRRRKERALRKLQSMDTNLVRAKDLQREIKRQLKPLERQADRVRRHRELEGRLQELGQTLAVDDLRQLQARHRKLMARDREAGAALELARYRADEGEQKLERYQSLLEQKGIFVGDLDEQRRRMQDILGRLDSDMRLLEEKGKNMVSRLSEMRMRLSVMEKQRADAVREKTSIDSDLIQARAQAEALRTSVKSLADATEAARAQRRKLAAQVSELQADQREAQRSYDKETLAYARLKDQIASAEATDAVYKSRLTRLSDQMDQASSAIQQREARRDKVRISLDAARATQRSADSLIKKCRDELANARRQDEQDRLALSRVQAKLEAIMALDQAAENKSQLVAALSSSEGAARIRCRLADLIEAPRELESTIESLLSDDLAALVVDGVDDIASLAAWTKDSRTEGTATLLARSFGEGGTAAAPTAAAPTAAAPTAAAPTAAAPTGEDLLCHIKAPAGYEDLMSGLLGSVRLVDTIQEALAAHMVEPRLTYMTSDATRVLADGRVIVGRTASAERGALERKRNIRELRLELTACQEAAAASSVALTRADAKLTSARDDRAQADGQIARLTGDLSSLTSELGRLCAERDAAADEHDQVTNTRKAAAAKVQSARDEIEKHAKAAAIARQSVQEISRRLDEASSDRGRAAGQEHDVTNRLTEEKLRLATTVERCNHFDARQKELTRSLSGLIERLDATRISATSLDIVRLRVNPLHDRYEAVHQNALEWHNKLLDRASLAEADSESLKQTIAAARESSRAAVQEMDAAQKEASAIKVEIGRVEVEVRHAIKAINATGAVLEEALELPAPKDRQAAEEEMERISKQLAQLGPVNAVAMEECARLKKRADYIAAQVEDLERARKALSKIAAAIERKMRQRFLAVFDAVNKNFTEVFGLLFPGGHAHLEMDDPDHPDTTGIQISAQPRGKRISKMMLMSGGEKSLTALALLFAVYKTRTVPFYIFDEVEAALDDANLTKLLDAIDQLKESTQLIVITHQRRTMESADVLYGVSMRSDGVSHVVSQRLDQATGKVVDA